MADHSTPAERITQYAADLGLDPPAVAATEATPPHAETTQRGDESVDDPDFTTTSSVRIQPIPPDVAAVGDYTTIRVTDQVHAESIEKKRPTCPTCGFVPTGEADPLALSLRTCYACATRVCPACGVECRACGKPMCDAHRDGHGLDDDPLCVVHAAQVAVKHRHTRDLERREEARKLLGEVLRDHRTRREKAWTREKQRTELLVDSQQKRFTNRVTAAKLQLAIWQVEAALRAQSAGASRGSGSGGPRANPQAASTQQRRP